MNLSSAEARRMLANMPHAPSRDAALANLAERPAQPERKPGRLDVTFALQVRNTLNEREQWPDRHARTANEKAVTLGELAGRDLPALPATVVLYRIGGNEMDGDGAQAALKYVRDAIAERYGIDDADDAEAGLTWHYGQRPGGAYAVRVVIETNRQTGGVQMAADADISPAERVARAADALEQMVRDQQENRIGCDSVHINRCEWELQQALEAWRRSK